MKAFPLCLAVAVLSLVHVAAQQGGRPGGAPFDLNARLQWELQAPWGIAHREALIEGGKLTIMNPVNIDAVRVEPFKMFDNVYYVGIRHVSAYLITTSEGLVLLDTSLPDTTELMLENIRKIGFKPEDIKYVLISHSHADHFGGAGRVKQLSGARVVSSAQDWAAIEAAQAAPPQQGRGGFTGVRLARDMVKGEGDTLKVGDNEFKFYLTPGHTVGALSAEFKVVDRGRAYRALSPGGLGIQFGAEWTERYAQGLAHLKRLGPWDVILTNHPFYLIEDTQTIRRGLANLGSGPHPMYSGPARIDAWFDGILKVAQAKRAAEQAAAR